MTHLLFYDLVELLVLDTIGYTCFGNTMKTMKAAPLENTSDYKNPYEKKS